MSKFTIDADLLTLMCALGERLRPTWLSHIHTDIPAEEIAAHIVWSAYDYLHYSYRDVLEAYCAGHATPTKETMRYLRERGFIIGADASIPVKVKEHCLMWYKFRMSE